MLALEASVYVIEIDILVVGLGMVFEVAAELANGANSLLPVTLDLGNTTFVVDEVSNIASPEAVLVSMLLGSATGLRVPRASTAGVDLLRGASARCGLKKHKGIRIFIVPPPIGPVHRRAFGNQQLRQALGGAVAAGGR